jgi:hypothetical protein
MCVCVSIFMCVYVRVFVGVRETLQATFDSHGEYHILNIIQKYDPLVRKE